MSAATRVLVIWTASLAGAWLARTLWKPKVFVTFGQRGTPLNYVVFWVCLAVGLCFGVAPLVRALLEDFYFPIRR